MIFSRRKNRTKLGRSAQNLVYASLENRRLLAGDVLVFDDGSVLRIIGDAEDNVIEISQNGNGDTIVTGIDTTINGLDTPHIESRFYLNLTVELVDGADEVTVSDQNVTRNVRVDGGRGSDRISINNLSAYYLHIEGAQGSDVIELEESFLRKSTYVFLGQGDDVLAANQFVSGRNMRVFGGEGNDTFAVGEFAVGRKFSVDLENGNDSALFLGDGEVNRSAKISAGDGNDFVGILPEQNDGTLQFNRRLQVDGNAGDDTVIIDSNAILNRFNRIDGGMGTDTFDAPVNQAHLRESGFESFQLDGLAELVDSVFDTLAAAGISESFFTLELTAPLEINLAQAALNYNENQEATAIDENVELNGQIDEAISGATISLMGFQADQDILSFTGANGISGIFDDQSGILTLSGTGDLAEYQAALREVWYENSSENPRTDERTIVVEVTTDSNELIMASRALQVVAVNDAPIINLSRSNVVVDSTSLPLTLDNQLEISDVDSMTLNSAVISIVDGFESGLDQLTFDGLAGVIGTYDPSTGALTFAGEATLQEYQTLLRSVQFEREGIPSSDQRTVRFTVDDGELDGFTEINLTIDV